MNLGERLYECRTEKGLTQAKLAEAVGCTKQTITNIENNRRGLTKDKAIRISEILGVDPDYLLGLTEWKNRSANSITYKDALAQLSEETGLSKDLIDKLKIIRYNGETTFFCILSFLISEYYAETTNTDNWLDDAPVKPSTTMTILDTLFNEDYLREVVKSFQRSGVNASVDALRDMKMRELRERISGESKEYSSFKKAFMAEREKK